MNSCMVHTAHGIHGAHGTHGAHSALQNVEKMEQKIIFKKKYANSICFKNIIFV